MKPHETQIPPCRRRRVRVRGRVTQMAGAWGTEALGAGGHTRSKT